MNIECKYVFKFRGTVRKELCSILDVNDKWRELAAWMGYNVREVEQIAKIARNTSPSDVLLERWGQKATTMHKLFVALSEIQHYQALLLIKDYVPEEYHTLIYEGEENLDIEDNGDEPEDSNIASRNDSVSKQVDCKLTDPYISATMSKEEIGLLPSSSFSTQHHSQMVKLVEQPEGGALPYNIVSHEAHVNGMFQNIMGPHAAVTITAPPSRFVPPEPCCHVDCPEVKAAVPNSSELYKNKTSPASTFSTAGVLSQNASVPARRDLGSSLASKKLILEALRE